MSEKESSSTVVDLDLRTIPKKGRSPKYPWRVWFNGSTHRLKQGVHYEADSPKSFRSSVYSAADRMGVVVITKIIEGDLHVQAIEGVTDEDDDSCDTAVDEDRP